MIEEKTVVAALPKEGWLPQYVGFCSERTAAHIGYHVGVGLSLLAQATPPTLTLPFSSPLASHMFIMLVGSSSKAFKTSAINQGLRILRDVAGDMLLEQPGSREALIDTVRSRPHGIVVYPEFGDFLATAYGDRSYARAMKTAYTSIYDSTPLGRSLVQKKGDKGGADPLKQALDPRMSILAGVATPFLEDYTEGPDWTGGFLGRFYTIYGDPQRTFRGEPLDDVEGRQQITELYRSLHYLHGERFTKPGPCLWLSTDGLDRWAAFNDEMEKRRKAAHPTVDAACSRAVGMAAKIALLLSWDTGAARVGPGRPWRVPTEIAESAIGLATLHLDSVTLLAERIVTGRDMQDRRKVLDAVPANAVVRLGDILRRAGMLKRRAFEILDTLVEEQVLAQIKSSSMGIWYVRKDKPERMAVIVEQLEELLRADRALPKPSSLAGELAPVIPIMQADATMPADPDFGAHPVWQTLPGDDADLAFPGSLEEAPPPDDADAPPEDAIEPF